MSDLRAPSGQPASWSEAAATDERIAEAFWKTYFWMSLGIGLTGFVAFAVAASPGLAAAILGNRAVFYVLLFGELGLVLLFSSIVHRVSALAAGAMFLTYAVVNGLTMSIIFMVYTQSSIASTFFVTGGAFAGLSLYGRLTGRDLSPMRSFLYMGLFGVIIASVVNIFLASPAITWVTTLAGIVVFSGLTAYDTQKLKVMFARGATGNAPLAGALMLYLDFVNLFLMLLRLFGRRR